MTNSEEQAGNEKKEENTLTVLDNFSVTMKSLFDEFVGQIKAINKRARMLSINAGIEAARSGDAGKGFAVVASEMNKLSSETLESAEDMEVKATESTQRIKTIARDLFDSVTGAKLASLAHNNIELIDRNLYERSCDVRWWATDKSVTDAAMPDATQDQLTYACKRLGVILNAYTVYFDIVLTDLNGKVIANGRPEQNKSIGTNQSNADWFRESVHSNSGDEYGFQTAHKSELVNGERVLIYSCSVRENGDANGKIIGVLGVVFRWDALAQTIVENTAISDEEKKFARVMIVDDKGLMLADTQHRALQDTFYYDGFARLMSEKINYDVADIESEGCIIGHAQSPGYETYKTGWHCIIVQKKRTR